VHLPEAKNVVKASTLFDKLIHHVEISSVQDFVGTGQFRLIKFQGDRIALVSPPMSINRKTQTFELVWACTWQHLINIVLVDLNSVAVLAGQMDVNPKIVS
jgi:Lipocalin-like domain